MVWPWDPIRSRRFKAILRFAPADLLTRLGEEIRPAQKVHLRNLGGRGGSAAQCSTHPAAYRGRVKNRIECKSSRKQGLPFQAGDLDQGDINAVG